MNSYGDIRQVLKIVCIQFCLWYKESTKEIEFYVSSTMITREQVSNTCSIFFPFQLEYLILWNSLQTLNLDFHVMMQVPKVISSMKPLLPAFSVLASLWDCPGPMKPDFLSSIQYLLRTLCILDGLLLIGTSNLGSPITLGFLSKVLAKLHSISLFKGGSINV